MPVETSIEIRQDTAAHWTATNPTLASGEFGLETDTKKLKLGDGAAAWAALPYRDAPTGGAPGGATTEIQFNDAGVFAGDAALTFDKATKSVAIGGANALKYDGATKKLLQNASTLTEAQLVEFASSNWYDATIAIARNVSNNELITSVGATDAQVVSGLILQVVALDGVTERGIAQMYYTETADGKGQLQLSQVHDATLNQLYSIDTEVTATTARAAFGTMFFGTTFRGFELFYSDSGATTAAKLFDHRLVANGVDSVPAFTNVAGATAGALVASNQQTIACAALGPVLVTVRGTGNPKIRTHEAGPGDGPPSQHAVFGNGDVFFIEATAPAVVTYVGSGFSGTWTVAT